MPSKIRNAKTRNAFSIQSDAVGDFILYPNGKKEYCLTTAITANVTTTTAVAGSFANTTHATGRASRFVSDGSKFQYLTNA